MSWDSWLRVACTRRSCRLRRVTVRSRLFSISFDWKRKWQREKEANKQKIAWFDSEVMHELTHTNKWGEWREGLFTYLQSVQVFFFDFFFSRNSLAIERIRFMSNAIATTTNLINSQNVSPDCHRPRLRSMVAHVMIDCHEMQSFALGRDSNCVYYRVEWIFFLILVILEIEVLTYKKKRF